MADLYKDLSHTGEEVNQAIERIASHIDDTVSHVTLLDRENWNAKQNALTFDSTPSEGSTNPVTSGGVFDAIKSINDLHRAVTLESESDLNDLYISQSPSTVDCVVRKWVIPSATVGASLLNLPASYKKAYPNAEIEWHTVKGNGVGYQFLTAGTNSSFQRFMRFRTAAGWSVWHTLYDTDNATV